MAEDSCVSRCPPAHLHTALRCLHDGLSADQRAALVRTLEQVGTTDRAAFSGLLIATRNDAIVAATWVQFTPGRAAMIWPPAWSGPAAKELLSAAAALLDEHGIALAQVLFTTTEPVREDVLAGGGFYRLADLAYLTLERANFPDLPPSALKFESRADEHPARLASIIQRTYEATLDCPELNDLREPSDVVAGYKVQGRFNNDHWYIASADGTDVGCLILAEHPPGESWELVYMGIVPEARSHGYGEQIVRFGIEQVRQSRAERLVLAVDERNQPALNMYHRAGFVLWDRRVVYARLRKQAKK